jgi:hypothetical protein
MKPGLTADEIRMLLESVDHYEAYLRSQTRENDALTALTKKLRGALKS